MGEAIKTIESKGCDESKQVANFISEMSKKHNVSPEYIMIGFVYNDKKDLYVWKWDSGANLTNQFKTLEIITL